MADARAADLLSEAGHLRRLALRDDRGARRVLCVRCRRKIPEGKRADAIYCSTACKRAYRWDLRDELKLEIGRAVRAQKTPAECPYCGEPLEPAVRPGVPAGAHRKCYNRVKQAEYRERKRREAARRRPAEVTPTLFPEV